MNHDKKKVAMIPDNSVAGPSAGRKRGLDGDGASLIMSITDTDSTFSKIQPGAKDGSWGGSGSLFSG
jgi:hypothetical protein